MANQPESTEHILQCVMTLSRHRAAKALSVSVSTLDRLVKAGRIRPVKIDARIVFTVEELKRFLNSEMEAQHA